jgi:hypothetical protein
MSERGRTTDRDPDRRKIARLEQENERLRDHADKYHRDFSDVVAAKFKAEQENERLRERLDSARGIAGILRTPTGLTGRDPKTQIAEYERRCQQAADMCDALSDPKGERSWSDQQEAYEQGRGFA